MVDNKKVLNLFELLTQELIVLLTENVEKSSIFIKEPAESLY